MALKSKPLDQVRTLPLEEVSQEEMVRINLNVPKSLRNAWKTVALEKETTLTDLIIESMRIYSHK